MPALASIQSGRSLTLPMGLPGHCGHLDAYIDMVNRLPMLSQEEEVSLAREYQHTNNLAAAQKMVLSHLRLVVSIARDYLGYGLLHADLIQEGNIGLMKAVKRFDPEQGVRLVSYAMHWIKAEIHEYVLKNWRLVKIATTKAQRKLFFNLRSKKQHLDTLTSKEVDDLAQTLQVKPKEVIEMETRLTGRDISLESSSNDMDEDKQAPIAWLSSNDYEPTHVLENKRLEYLQSHGLESALNTLDERSHRIVSSRWLANDDGSGATLNELASEFGISAERVRQIEVAAFKKMHGVLQQIV